MTHWYCVKLSEKHAFNALQRLNREIGIEVFYPLIPSFRTRRDCSAKRVSYLPLFKGYGFIRADLSVVSVMDIKYIQGVHELLDTRKPMPLSFAVIDELKSKTMCNFSGRPQNKEIHKYLDLDSLSSIVCPIERFICFWKIISKVKVCEYEEN